LILVSIISSIYLGFILGRTYQIKKEIKKQSYCEYKVLNSDINLKKEYQENIHVDNLFIHAYAMVVLKHQECMWSYDGNH